MKYLYTLPTRVCQALLYSSLMVLIGLFIILSAVVVVIFLLSPSANITEGEADAFYNECRISLKGGIEDIKKLWTNSYEK
jgi:hypothetical protein